MRRFGWAVVCCAALAASSSADDQLSDADQKILDELQRTGDQTGIDVRHLAKGKSVVGITLSTAPLDGQPKTKGLAGVIRQLRGFGSLELLALRVREGEFDADAAKELAALPNLRTIQYATRTEGARPTQPDAFLGAVAGLQSLEVLDIGDRGLTVGSLQKLRKLKTLKGLSLQGHQLPDEAVEELRVALKLADWWSNVGVADDGPLRGLRSARADAIDFEALAKLVPAELKDDDDRLTRLLKLRFRVALEGLKYRAAEFANGRGVQDVMLQGMLRVRDAGMELSATPEAKVALLRAVRDTARALELINVGRYESGRINVQDFLQTRQTRLDIEIELARLEKKLAPPKP